MGDSGILRGDSGSITERLSSAGSWACNKSIFRAVFYWVARVKDEIYHVKHVSRIFLVSSKTDQLIVLRKFIFKSGHFVVFINEIWSYIAPNRFIDLRSTTTLAHSRINTGRIQIWKSGDGERNSDASFENKSFFNYWGLLQQHIVSKAQNKGSFPPMIKYLLPIQKWGLLEMWKTI